MKMASQRSVAVMGECGSNDLDNQRNSSQRVFGDGQHLQGSNSSRSLLALFTEFVETKDIMFCFCLAERLSYREFLLRGLPIALFLGHPSQQVVRVAVAGINADGGSRMTPGIVGPADFLVCSRQLIENVSV
jgi:hypothetical protein